MRSVAYVAAGIAVSYQRVRVIRDAQAREPSSHLHPQASAALAVDQIVLLRDRADSGLGGEFGDEHAADGDDPSLGEVEVG